MPFGLKNAASTFQRVIDYILKDLIGTVCLVYLDDIIIYSTSLQEHVENLKKFLGDRIVKLNPDKKNQNSKFSNPNHPKINNIFLRPLGYYHIFLKDFAKITKPFTVCLKKTNLL